ncbi:MAG: FAD-dependent oxidoreductase [Chloroflexi bacterium]|nr:FAD-dependent oxidoreductase [Chloroflexota bacterium]
MIRTERIDVAVIGGGPAGMAAASASRQAGAARVVLIERDPRLGGILNQCIHDGFGTKVFKEALTGPEFAGIYARKLKESGVETWLESTVIGFSPDRVLTICSRKGITRLETGAVVLAMGCRERSRGAIGISGTRPAGIYTAGAVQAYMNLRNIAVGRRFVILGSGDVGLIMARRLSLEGAEVVCVAEILPYPSGLARNVVQCLEDFGIPLYLNTTVVEIHGNSRVTGVTLAEVEPGGKMKRGSRRRVVCDTLMLSVGLIPENELSARAGVKLSPVTRGPVVDDSFQTSIPGVFACGNVLQVHDLVDYATLEAEKAGQSAARYSQAQVLPAANIPVEAGAGIRYVLPALVSGQEAVDFTMRVTAPSRERAIVFTDGTKEIRRLQQQVLAPAAMARVRLNRGRFDGAKKLVVEVAD